MTSTTDGSARAYADLLEMYWQEAPGTASGRELKSLEDIKDFLAQRDRLDQLAVALNFAANEGLLLGGNLLARGQSDEAWLVFDKAQARGYLAHKIYRLAAWELSAYSAPVFDFASFCAFFSLAMARSDFAQSTWYAQQIYNLRRGGLADDSCPSTDYVELYWELAIAWLNRAWPEPEQISGQLGCYEGLFVGGSSEPKKALEVCADYHLDVAIGVSSPREHPYTSRSVGHLAYELMGWVALKKYLDGTNDFPLAHPMLLRDFLDTSPQRPCKDPVLEKISELAEFIYGGELHEASRSFDAIWPDA